METPAKPRRTGPSRLRKLLYDIHLWVGLILGLPLVVVSVTGALLVWHDGLDALLHPERQVEAETAALLPLAAYEEAARAALPPGAVPISIALPETAGDAVIVSGRGASEPGRPPLFGRVWLHPETAALLDRMESGQFSLIGVLHRLHGSLMLPGGRQIVGWLGVAMAASCLTGLWLWWPGRQGVVKALGWRRGLKTSGNLHHIGGFWILLPLTVVTLTGVYISFPQTGQALLTTLGAEVPERSGRPRFSPPLTAPALSADAALAAAGQVTTAAPLSLAYPTEASAEWRIKTRDGGEVTVADADSATTVRPGTGGDMPLPLLIRRIHDGQGMGLLWQSFVFATGVLPVLLTVTGVLMWLRKRRNRRALARLKAEALRRAAARG